jgi:hypothetical protein
MRGRQDHTSPICGRAVDAELVGEGLVCEWRRMGTVYQVMTRGEGFRPHPIAKPTDLSHKTERGDFKKRQPQRVRGLVSLHGLEQFAHLDAER